MTPRTQSMCLGIIVGFIAGMLVTGYAKSDDLTPEDLQIAAQAPPLLAPVPDHEQINPAVVSQVAEKVRAILAGRGFKIGAEEFPAYTMRLNGLSGMAIAGVAIVNSERPEECLPADLGHELAHLMLGKYHGLTPSQSEPHARVVDEVMIQRPYRPNCGSERK